MRDVELYEIIFFINYCWINYFNNKESIFCIVFVCGKLGGCYCLLNCILWLCIYLIIVWNIMILVDILIIGYWCGCVVWDIDMYCCCCGYGFCGMELYGR